MPSDLIYREDAKDFVRHAYNKGLNPIEYLDEVPAADVRTVVRGTWEGETDFVYADLSQRVICDKCGAFAYFYDKMPMNFCPNCGADMRPDKNGQIGEKDNG